MLEPPSASPAMAALPPADPPLPMAPAPADLPAAPVAPAAPAAGEPLLMEPPPPPPPMDGALPPPVVESEAAQEAAAELGKDADQAANAEDKLDHLKSKMLGEMGGPAVEGPRIQSAIEGFVVKERANLHNLETELENAALA